MRDKLHMESVEKWAEFVRAHPREEWKRVVDVFVNAVYEKSQAFYARLEKTEEGREILARLKVERLKSVKRG
ncbi:MAG TPA: hypothetical protein VJK07_03625 [Candidatus Nanoarchaeia archaeon]|nr:hypothetical protein [Candidatus Nanoarchaeia archaeon]